MKRFMICFVLSIGLISCSDDKKTTPQSTGEKISSLAGAAFTSTANALSYASLAGLSDVNILATCDTNGDPTSSASPAKAYAGEKFYCQLSTDSGSPDTLKGSYSLVMAVLTCVERKVALTYPLVAKTHPSFVVAKNDNCLSGTSDFPYENDFNFAIRESSLTGSDWDSLLEIEFTTGTFTNPEYKIYLKDSNGVIGAKVAEKSGANWSAISLLIDQTNSKVRFENWDFSNSRHIRLFIDGTMGTNGSFTNVSRATMIHTTGATEVLFDFNGTNEWVDHWVTGPARAADHPHCDMDDGNLAPCTGLGITRNANFGNFGANQAALNTMAVSDTTGYINFTAPLVMADFL